MTELEYYYQKGIPYKEYISQIHQSIQQQKPLSDYAEMNMKRSERVEKTFQLSEEEKLQIQQLSNSQRILIISEGWCGDASQSVPVFEIFFQEMGIEPRYIFRDENLNLMNSYLTDGALSIPIVIGINDEGMETFHFGPRPKEAMALLLKQKQNPETYSKEDFYLDLQKFYNSDKGKSTVKELIEAMN